MFKRFLGALIGVALAIPAFAADFRIVVNANNPVASITKATVRSYFLGSATRWPDGATVKPIDLPESSSVRALFSKQVLGKDTAAVKSHWIVIVFAGRGTPPVELDEDKVLSTVKSTPSAIGYVSATATLSAGVKAVPISD